MAEAKLGANRKHERQSDFPVPRLLKKLRNEALHPTGVPRKFRLMKIGDDQNIDQSFVPLRRAFVVEAVACWNRGFVVRLAGLGGQSWAQLHPQIVKAIAKQLGVDASQDYAALAVAISEKLDGSVRVESQLKRNYAKKSDGRNGKPIPFVAVLAAD